MHKSKPGETGHFLRVHESTGRHLDCMILNCRCSGIRKSQPFAVAAGRDGLWWIVRVGRQGGGAIERASGQLVEVTEPVAAPLAAGVNDGEHPLDEPTPRLAVATL